MLAKASQFTSWSFTRYNDWRTCPLFAKLKHLDKLPTPKHPAMERGAMVARASEDYLKKKTNKLIPELHSFKDAYKFFRKQRNLMVEENWGFDSKWNPVPWNDWDRCTLRVKVDIGYIDNADNELHIRDGKTGKFRENKNEEYMLQLELYTAAGVAMHPHVDKVIPRLLYTDLGISYPDGERVPDVVYTADEARGLQKKWDRRVKPFFAEKRFAPRPGAGCQWCAFSKSKGGPCKY